MSVAGVCAHGSCTLQARHLLVTIRRNVGELSAAHLPDLACALPAAQMEELVAALMARGAWLELRVLCNGQTGRAGSCGSALAHLLPLVGEAVAANACPELDDVAWKHLNAFVDALVLGAEAAGGDSAALQPSSSPFHLRRLIAALVDNCADECVDATLVNSVLQRVFGLVRGALACCVPSAAFEVRMRRAGNASRASGVAGCVGRKRFVAAVGSL